MSAIISSHKLNQITGLYYIFFILLCSQMKFILYSDENYISKYNINSFAVSQSVQYFSMFFILFFIHSWQFAICNVYVFHISAVDHTLFISLLYVIHINLASGGRRQELGCGTESRSIPAQSKPTTCWVLQNDSPPRRAIQSTYL